MSDHIPDATKMLADGFYNALVQCDTGGEMRHVVRIHGGRVYTAHPYELKPSACSEFTPLGTESYCTHWPHLAAAELTTLRAAVRALHAELQGGKFATIPVEDILSGKVTL
jgi:hypothetical protein